MSEPFLGEIEIFAFNFAPTGWALCNGQLLPISQNTALFSLLGTQFGGDGRTTFALPNLQGSIPNHQGQGAGLSNYSIGQTGGSATVALTVNNLAPHTHTLPVSSANGRVQTPTSANVLGELGGRGGGGSAYGTTSLANMAVQHNTAGNGTSPTHNNMAPYVVLNYCIAMQGIFPSRS